MIKRIKRQQRFDMKTFTVAEAKTHLCYFFGRLDTDW